MQPADSKEQNLVILKLAGFEQALSDWILAEVFPVFFGEPIGAHTAWRVQGFIDAHFHEFLRDFPSITGYYTHPPTSDDNAIYLDIDLEMGLDKITKGIRIGSHISHEFNF